MGKCTQCKIEILDKGEYCPLCHNVLVQTETGENTYPDIYTAQRKLGLVMRVLAFVDIAVVMVCMFINIAMRQETLWFLIVAGALLYPLYLLSLAARHKTVILRIFGAMAGAVAFIILVDFVLGYRGWSVDYVLPGAVIFMDALMILLMLVNRGRWQSYLMPQIYLILICAVTLVLIFCGVVQHPLTSEIAFMAAVIVFLGTLILGGGTAMTELKRRFHI